MPGREFYLASQKFAEAHPQIAQQFLGELIKVKAWAKTHPREVAERLAADMGMEADVLEVAERRRERHGTIPMTPEIIAEQQQVADAFFELGLLSKRIKVSDVVRNLIAPAPEKEN